MIHRFKRDALWGILLCLLPLLLFAPVTLGNQTLIPGDALYLFEPYRSLPNAPLTPHNPLLSDLILENYPWKRFLVHSLQAGDLPLWDPYLFGGHPFLANGQHSALYPLTWLCFLLPLPRAFGVFMTLQLGLAGLSMYILGRTLRAHRLSALLAGITFQLSGFLVISAVHPMIVAAASWLPLLLALVDLTVRRASLPGPVSDRAPRVMLPWALLGAIILGLEILAGHAEITYFTLLVMGMFAAWRLAHTALTQPRATWRSDVLSPAIGLCIMVGLGLALGAVQLAPLYEVVQTSFRQGAVTLSDVLSWAYPKRRIITFLVPNFFGNPTHRALQDLFTGATVQAPNGAFDWGIKNYVEGAAYLGILPLFLAVIAILRPPKARISGSADQRKGEKAKKQVSDSVLSPQSSVLSPQHSALSTSSKIKTWFAHPYVPFFTFLSLFSLGCIFGTPVYALVYALPFLNQSHSPFRWVFPLTAALAALSALGATTVAEYRHTHGPEGERARGRGGAGELKAEGRRQKAEGSRFTFHVSCFTFHVPRWLMFDTSPNAVSLVAVAALWMGVLLLAGLWGSRLLFGPMEPLVARAFWALARAPEAFPDHRAFYSYLFPWIQTAALLLIGAGCVLRVARCPIYLPRRLGRRPVWEAMAVALLVLDLVSFGAGFNPATDPALLTAEPPSIAFLKQQPGLWRFSTFAPHGQNTLSANAGMIHDLQDVRGYDSLFTAQYARYMGWIEPQGGLPYNRIAPFTQFSSLDSPLTDLLNVQYILTEEEIPLPKYRQVYQDAAVRIYENLGVTPRAFTLPESATLIAPDVEAVGQAIQTYDPRFYAIVEAAQVAGLQLPATPEPATAQSQPVVSYTANEVLIEATVDAPAWLILADAYFPGWKAFTRPPGAGEDAETEVPIARVAGNFRGIRLEESATVRFKYSPNSVKIGAFTSFLGGMTWLFCAVLWLWRRVYREDDGASTVQRVAKNSVAPIALTLFNRVMEFAFAALMLRILGPANAGDYYLAGSVFVWFEIVTNFGLDAYLTREVARCREQANRYFFNTTVLRLLLSVLGVSLLAGFILTRQTLIARLTGPASTQAMIALALLYVGLIPGSLSKGLTSLFYAYEKAEYPAAITTITTLLKVTVQTLVLLSGGGIIGLAGAAVGINVVTLAILGTLALRLFFKPRWEPARALQREMLQVSWPLMVNHFLATIFFKVDVFLLEAIQGNAVLGYYSIGYKFLDTLNAIPAMFTLAIFPVISRLARESAADFLRFYRLGAKLLIALAAPAAVLATLAAREMVLVLGGPEYLPDAMIALRLMSWSLVFGWFNSLTQYVLIALDEQRYLTRAYAWGVAFTLIANLLLIPRFSYQASALLHIFSELALLLPFAWGVQRRLGQVGWRDIAGKPLAATLVMILVALALSPVGRLPAFCGALVTYPLAAWRLGLLTPEERALLAPLLRRGKA